MPSGIEITTVMILLRHSRVEEAHKTELKKEMLFFSGVTLIDPQLIRWNTIRFQRNNQSYRIICSIKRAACQPISYISTSMAVRVGWTIMEKG